MTLSLRENYKRAGVLIIMARTYHHRKGDGGNIRKTKAGSRAVPRYWWNAGKITNKKARKNALAHELREEAL